MPEIKSQNEKKYLYVRKRVAGKLTSTYVDVYSDELYQLLLKNAKESRALNKRISHIERIVLSEKKPIDIAIDLCLYCMKTQIFIDNKTISQEYYRNAKIFFVR